MVRAVDQIVEFERGATSVNLLELLADAVVGSLDLPPPNAFLAVRVALHEI